MQLGNYERLSMHVRYREKRKDQGLHIALKMFQHSLEIESITSNCTNK